MKKAIWGIIVLIVIIAVVAYQNNKSPSSTETFKIGYSGIQTGPAAFIGETYAIGMRAALKEINENGGINGRQVEIFEEDNMYTGKGGVDAFNALKLRGAEFIISVGSTPTVPLSPLARDAGIPVLAAAIFADILTDNPNAVRMSVIPTEDVKATIPDMQKAGVKKVGVLYINNEYGVANLADFKAEAARGGITVVSEEPFLTGAAEFATPVLKLLSNDIDAVYVIDLGFVAPVDQLKRQITAQSKTTKIFLNAVAYASNTVFKNPAVFDGVYMTVPLVSIDNTPQRKSLIEKIGAEENTTDALAYQSLGYDDLMAIAAVLEKNDDLSKFAETFKSFGKFEGVNGTYNLNSRDVGVPVVPAIFQGGKLVLSQ